VEQAAAAEWALPPAHYTLSYSPAAGWRVEPEPGGDSSRARVIESAAVQPAPGQSLVRHHRRRSTEAQEEHGDVWFGALAWSGSWRITVEQDQLDSVRITGGFNPFDFGDVLHPGDSLETPIFYGGYAAAASAVLRACFTTLSFSTFCPTLPQPQRPSCAPSSTTPGSNRVQGE